MDFKKLQFGGEMRDEFLLDKSITPVNQGSFGAVPKCVFEKRLELLREQENNPDVWFRVKLEKYYEESLTAAAKFLGAEKDNLVLVDNVTTGINTAVKSLSFERGDKILTHSHMYCAVQNIVSEQKEKNGIEVLTINIPQPSKSEDQLVDSFRSAFKENPDIKLAIFDHITSPSAIIFPVEKLVNLCKEYGILSLIDGAHSPGQLDVNLESIGADFYSGNFHKWCYVPRSCGFLYFSPKFQSKIRPLVTSNNYKKSLSSQFALLGTRDTSSTFCIPYSLKFYEAIGGTKAVQSYCRDLMTYAEKILSEALGTEVADVPYSMKAPFMTSIQLPMPSPERKEDVWAMSLDFYVKHKVQAMFDVINGKACMRCSANIYNTKEDYDKVKDAIVIYMEKFRTT